eukprot:Plantae.Rhodophyta-Hildenbrandia_rubra.ctg11595.p1 GENE.Plantae.Rhodophyta-Hildenbrandia_rubra.ctg11595~~Plantae.Rhodophyta-Hildenbrandia_rubra.ctg11595.p1  ORF type:complete len:547 (+),score=100.74 Plantae.Rhodophyta-Hildenbrandia_rubra.ctg11595:2113-3753(+)
MAGSTVQVVDVDGNINEDFPWFDDEDELGSECLNIVSILGPQASGKSTLLNKVFGTDFNVAGRGAVGSATTKGIACAKPKDNPRLVVFDVEGSDARERKKTGRKFQARCSGFASCLSDVVIMNVWYHDIGRLDGTGYALMKSVMNETVNAVEDGSAQKSAIVFAVRDTEEGVEDDELEKMLLSDVEELWKSFGSKTENVDLNSCFQFEVCSLPHMKHRPEEFEEACKQFAKRFSETDSSEYLLKTELSKGVPADGLGALARHYWDSFDSSYFGGAGEDLAEADEEVMKAAYRCNEAFSEALKAASSKMSELSTTLDGKSKVPDFGSKCTDVLKSTLATYDEASEDWKDEPIQSRKRRELESIIDTSLHALFMKQLQLIREGALSHFKTGSTSDDLPPELAFFKADSKFQKEAEDSIPAGSSWSFENERGDLQTMMQEISMQRKKLLSSQVTAAQQQANAMQYLQMQQANLQAIEQTAYSGGPGQWNIGAAYRPPDTNVNISMGYQGGRTNIQVSMVPDEAASLLGPSGFSSGVGPANLGLSFNVNV